jgi:hypothetical protein
MYANKVSKYSKHTEFCYADGYIHAREFHIERAHEPLRPIRYGTLGQEKVEMCDVSSAKDCYGVLNMSCKPVEYSSASCPLGEKSVVAIQLRAGDGAFVTLTRRLGDEPDNPESRKRLSQPLLLVNERFPTGKQLPYRD